MSEHNNVGQFSEREASLEALAFAIEQAKSGRGSVSFVLGEAGLGKTSLITLVRQWAQGLHVGFGEGVAAESALPFGILTQALGPLGGFDGLGAMEGLGSAEARGALYYRTARWMEQATADGPLVLAFDDLHWADPDSLNLLGFLFRRMPDAVTVVATMRPWPEEASTMAEALCSEGRAGIERLAPLSEEAAARLLETACGRDLSVSEAQPLLASCAGNPLLLEQAGAAMQADHFGRDRGPGNQRSGGLLVSRFGGLPASAFRIAQAASVFGVRFRSPLVSKVAGVPQREADEAICALITAGLARDLADGLVEFVHPLFAQAIYDDLAAPTRGRLHGLAMRTLITNGAPPAEAAAHARAGHLVGDPKAIAVLEAAGRAALATGGIESALIDLRAAVELAGTTAAASLLLALANAELAAGHVETTVAMCEQLLTNQSDPSMRCDVRLTQARASFLAGNPDVAEEYFEAAIRAVSPDPGRTLNILMEAAASCMTMSGPLRNLGWMDRALEILGPQAEADRTPVELAWGCIAAMTGNLDGANMALKAFADGRFDATIAKAPSALVTWLAFCAMWVGQMTERFDVAEHTFEKTWEIAEFLGSPLSITMLGQGRASVLCRRGRLAEAGEIVNAINNANAGLVGGLAATVAMPNAFLALESGDPKGANLACVQLESQFLEGRSSTYPVIWIWLWKVRAELALDAGRVHDAAELSISMRDLAATSRIVEPCAVPWADTAMAAFLRAGRYGDAESLIGHLETVSSGWPCAWPRSVAESGRAGLAEGRRDHDAADHHYRRTIGLLNDVDLPLARARALIDHGTFLRRTGRPTEARQPLARAAELAGACGATRLEDSALAELRASGGRRRRSTTELSPQEQRVAHLAAHGATNPQIAAALVLSVKTVEHHLSSAYTKLGIHSRLELKAHLKPDPT